MNGNTANILIDSHRLSYRVVADSFCVLSLHCAYTAHMFWLILKTLFDTIEREKKKYWIAVRSQNSDATICRIAELSIVWLPNGGRKRRNYCRTVRIHVYRCRAASLCRARQIDMDKKKAKQKKCNGNLLSSYFFPSSVAQTRKQCQMWYDCRDTAAHIIRHHRVSRYGEEYAHPLLIGYAHFICVLAKMEMRNALKTFALAIHIDERVN